jgi:hypothetical protein
MLDRDYELVRMTMREREQEARLQRLARGERGTAVSLTRRLAMALEGVGARLSQRGSAVKKMLERDGTVTCPDAALVHRPWSDTPR